MESLQNSTQHNYYCMWKTFNEFVIKLDVKPSSWESKLQLFVGYLINKGSQSQTVKSYISAIKTILMMENIVLNYDSFLLGAVTKACKFKNDRVRNRLPIHQDLLNIILSQVSKHFANKGQLYLGHVYSVLFSAGYYGMLRVGELTSGCHPILVTDVQLAANKKKMMFVLQTSKTHGLYDKPQLVKIKEAPDSLKGCLKHSVVDIKHYCPYQLLLTFSKVRLQYKSEIEPFFVFKDRSPVCPSHMWRTLKDMISQARFDPNCYDTHSLRIGRSCDLLRLGLSVETIKKLG